MIEITKEIEIDMAHRLSNHEGKCRSLHGHRYKIEATAEGEIIECGKSIGMLIDYSDLKQVMIDYIDEKFDHGAVFYNEDPFKKYFIQMIDLGEQNPDKLHFVNFMPTAENLCKYWFELIEGPLIKNYGIKLKKLKVWETPTSSAVYTK